MSSEPANSAISLFSGAGGLDLGLENSDWQILAQIEIDSDCANTLSQNALRRRRSTKVFNALIEEIDPKELRRALGLKPGELGLIAGGPPCQPFTTTGLRQAMRDRRAETVFPTWLKWIEEFQPSAFVMENVDGLLSCALRHRKLSNRGKGYPPLEPDERKGSFLKWLLDQLASMGYTVTWGVVEAADYGVPQLRQRAFLIGVLDGDSPCFFPRPRFGSQTNKPYRTLRHAISRIKHIGPVQPLSDFKRSVFSKIPAGGNWRDLPQKLQRETMGAAFKATGGKNGWWRRLSWESPSPTILGMPDHSSTGLIHPDEVRCLSANECRAIQTFPSNYKFSGKPRSQYQQIGNAVPVKLGFAIGSQIKKFREGLRLPIPEPPQWQSVSANRRIGTHGWVAPGSISGGPQYSILVKVRDDHIWAYESEMQLFQLAS